MSVAIDAPITIPQRGDGNRSRSVGARQRLAPDQRPAGLDTGARQRLAPV